MAKVAENLPFRTNKIKLNVPPKVIGGDITSATVSRYWNYANGTGDKWWALGSNPRGYEYELDINITAQTHGSNLTRKEFEYNGIDVNVGDWIAYTADGVCLKIVSILSKSETAITVIAQDYQRYNTFKLASGSPIGTGSTCIIFALQESGLPIIDPLPTGPGIKFETNVSSRFSHQNVRDNFELEIFNNGFIAGEVLSAWQGSIVKANATTAQNTIGVVSAAGPGPDFVTIRPHSRFVDYDTDIPTSTIGDRVYVTVNGGLTTLSANSTGRSAYIVVQEAIPTSLTGSVNNPSFSTSAFSTTINETPISFTGTENLTQILSKINAETSNTGVVASDPTEENNAVSGTLSLAYGLVGGFVPFSANINGYPVNFTTSTFGQARYSAAVGVPEDMKVDIDAVNIPNLVVSAPGDGTLTLTEVNGNAITIVNTSTDNTGTGGAGVGFAGTNSATGIPLSNSAKTNLRLRLTRADGGPIDIYDAALNFETATGVYSGQNGRPVVAAFVYDGLRQASTVVVADITARNAITPAVGDMAYVLNDGTGSYAIYLWDGSNWSKLATEESATVDARTYQVEYNLGVSNSTILFGNVSVDRKIETVNIEVTTAFDDANANVEVGTIALPTVLMEGNENDLSATGIYGVTPDYYTSDGAGQDTLFYLNVNAGTSTQGNIVATLTYV